MGPCAAAAAAADGDDDDDEAFVRLRARAAPGHAHYREVRAHAARCIFKCDIQMSILFQEYFCWIFFFFSINTADMRTSPQLLPWMTRGVEFSCWLHVYRYTWKTTFGSPGCVKTS